MKWTEQARCSLPRVPVWLFLACLSISPAFAVQNKQIDAHCRPYPDFALQPPPVNIAPGPEYAPSTRIYQATPTIERTSAGRLWAAWVSGGPDEGRFNYIILAASDDNGQSWSDAKLVIDPPGSVAASDPRLWSDPLGRLWLFWSQAYAGADGRDGVWAIVADTHDVSARSWSKPVRIADGRVGGKPTVLRNGTWLLPIYVQADTTDFDEAVAYYHLGLSPCVLRAIKHEVGPGAGARVYGSGDQGKTWNLLGTARSSPIGTPTGDDVVEPIIVERRDGSLWMLARSAPGIGQSISSDGGKTWTPVQPSGIRHPLSRFFLGRLRSGRLLLIRHNPPSVEYPTNCHDCGELNRSHLSAYLSDDDGKSWKGGLLLDGRSDVSYPDPMQSTDGTIFAIYDRDRRTTREILLSSFREEDVINGECTSPVCRLRIVVSKGSGSLP